MKHKMTKYKLNQMFRLKDGSICSIEEIQGTKLITLLTTENTQGIVVFSEEQLDEQLSTEFVWELKDKKQS